MMEEYNVEISLVIDYSIPVIAKSPEEAEQMAIDVMYNFEPLSESIDDIQVAKKVK